MPINKTAVNLSNVVFMRPLEYTVIAYRKHPVRGNGPSPPESSQPDEPNFFARIWRTTGRTIGRKVMPTVSRSLPRQPHLDVPKRQARELLKDWRAGKADAFDRIRRRHPKFHDATDIELKSAAFRLNDAQLVVAREYGLANW